MKTQPTTTVLRGQLQCRGAEASFRTHREEVGAELTKYFAPYTPEGIDPVDWQLVLLTMELAVKDIRLGLVNNEQVYLDAKVERNDRYNETRSSTRSTRGYLLDLKSTTEGILGEESHTKLGLSGTLPSAPVPVLRLGKRVYDGLEKPEKLRLGTPSKGGVVMDFVETRTQLEPLIDDLQDKVTIYDDAKRLAEQALERRRGAETRYRGEYPALVRMGVGLYRLIGEKEAADRLRVASRRRPGDPQPEAKPDSQETSPDAAPEPEAAEGPPAETNATG